MRKIRINIELTTQDIKDNRVDNRVWKSKESFLEATGIELDGNRHVCSKEFVPYITGDIVDESKFEQYTSEYKLNYELL